MATPLYMAPTPCTTCPYRRDTPSGVWAEEEYRKLPTYDNHDFCTANLKVFHCHQEREIGKPTVCHGWVSVHADGKAVRLACISGLISEEDMARIPIQADPALYATGAEACRAGLKGVNRPGKKARRAIERISKRR
jgi:hypothetical protein